MLQEQLGQFQAQLKQTEVTGTAGNGLVTLRINGDHEMTSLRIQPDCVDPEDVEGLEDLIKAAYKDALKKLESTASAMPSLPGL